MQQRYDIIIAGGGVAGLSLAYALTQSPLRDRSILIVERSIAQTANRTLSYWADRPTPFDAIAARSWDRLQMVHEDGSAQAIGLDEYRYHTVRGEDFVAFVHQAIAACPHAEIVTGTVEAIEDGAHGAAVTIDGQRVQATWAFDSRFRPSDCDPDGTARTLYQHFKGWEIETAEPVFDPGVATLFDCRLPQRGEWRFFYVLPYTEHRALVEVVALSRDGFDMLLRGYIERTLGISHYRVLAKEAGVTPLSDWRFPRRIGQHVMTIGVRGGRVKPSSGYAFQRIQDDSAAIARALLHDEDPFGVRESRRFPRLCDAGTLRIMQQRGEWLNPLMAGLFAQNPPDRILRFLDERAGWIERLAVGASVLSVLVRQALTPRPAAPQPRTDLCRTTSQ
ncbi:lycopene cyclase family protein [Aggregatilinea lenta]|uniref:lycopene cyclase family protein n=1 Tax=Aggregatilinea lenta TaxID=913108 RepID=UPI000E5BA51D|nr:lycopene cyclase family protein [Aggregatilinea lenta]